MSFYVSARHFVRNRLVQHQLTQMGQRLSERQEELQLPDMGKEGESSDSGSKAIQGLLMSK